MSPTARRQTVFVAVFLVVGVLFVITFRMGVVRGQSMEPTYQDGQIVLVRRSHSDHPTLHHNDVILLRKDRDVIIKRVYRLPGEEIDRSPPDLYDQALFSGQDDYYEQQTVRTPYGPRRHLFVPKDYLVVLGDNQAVSEDSRVFGPVPLRDVLGVVADKTLPPWLLDGPRPPGRQASNSDKSLSDTP